jgi:pimeloyl-ACP methyl ester carboxylesterase
MMRLLGRRLEAAGYRVRNWSYPSMWQPIAQHGQRLHRELSQCDQSGQVTRIHLVGHSLGAVVARCALNLGKPSKLGRVVMLAPPNKGSRLATFCVPWLGWLCGPIVELTEGVDSFVNQLAVPEGIDVGVIAASSDLFVKRECTHLAGERDHLVLPGTHGMIVFQRGPAEQTVHFLKHGHFEPAPHHSFVVVAEKGAGSRGEPPQP